MNSNAGVNISLAIGSGLSAIANFCGFVYIRKTYNVANSLYFILALDALFVTIVSACMLPLYIYLSIVEKTDALTCTFQLFGFPMLPNILPSIGFWISLIR